MKKKSKKYLEYSEDLKASLTKVWLEVFSNHISELIFEVERAKEQNDETRKRILQEIDDLNSMVEDTVRGSFNMGVIFAKKFNKKE